MQPHERYHDLDALRAGAMLLGIALHGCLSFLGWEIWPIQDIHQSRNGYGLLAAFIHGFRMPLFFLISGFFTAMLFHKRGLRHLLMHRTKRILIPLLLSCLLILPLANVITVALGQGSPKSILGLLFWPHGEFLFHHLWFLYFLVWLVLGFALVTWILRRRQDTQPKAFHPAAWLIGLALTCAFQWQFDEFGPTTDVDLMPGFTILGYYAVFFGFGAKCYGQDAFFERLSRKFGVYLLLAIPALIAGGILSEEQFENYNKLHPWATFFTSAYAWFMCLASIGLFRRFFSADNPTIRYVSDSSYFLYLAHLPVIMLLQQWVRTWDVPSFLKFVLVCTLATGGLLVVYRYCIRYSWVGTMLNGKRVG